jgi:hypothetical protein
MSRGVCSTGTSGAIPTTGPRALPLRAPPIPVGFATAPFLHDWRGPSRQWSNKGPVVGKGAAFRPLGRPRPCLGLSPAIASHPSASHDRAVAGQPRPAAVQGDLEHRSAAETLLRRLDRAQGAPGGVLGRKPSGVMALRRPPGTDRQDVSGLGRPHTHLPALNPLAPRPTPPVPRYPPLPASRPPTAGHPAVRASRPTVDAPRSPCVQADRRGAP